MFSQTKIETLAGTTLGIVAGGGYGTLMTVILAGPSSPLIAPVAVGCSIVCGSIGGSFAYGSSLPPTPLKVKLKETAKYALFGGLIGQLIATSTLLWGGIDVADKTNSISGISDYAKQNCSTSHSYSRGCAPFDCPNATFAEQINNQVEQICKPFRDTISHYVLPSLTGGLLAIGGLFGRWKGQVNVREEIPSSASMALLNPNDASSSNTYSSP